MRLLALVALAALPVAAQHPPLTIGSVTAAPGTMASGYLAVPEGPDGATRIPITIVRGARPGPVLALVAGTHGSEVASILGLVAVRGAIDPAAVSGTILMVHVANMPSFLGRTIYYSPADGKNLNRVYPGRPDGTLSERIAHVITTEIIARADYLVDMHGGDGNESLRPYTYWNRLGLDARADSIGREMALAWGNPYIVVDTTRPRDPAASVYTQNTAHVRGKPAITTESGFLGVPDPAMIARNSDGVWRLLRYLRMVPGPIALVEHPVWFHRTEVLRSPATGLFEPLVERGHTVAAGAVVGVVRDFFGTTVAEIRAPFTGVVLYVVGTPAMSADEPVAMIGEPATTP